MRMVVVRISDGLRSWEELDRWLERYALDVISCGWERRSGYTYPSKSQGHLEHEVGGKYNQEVPRCIFHHDSQNAWKLDFRCLRLYRQENDQREREEIWCIYITRRAGRH